jgi:hypothetical protein
MILTSEQLAFFKDNGYLILEGVLDREKCARVRDRVWDTLPPDSHLKRDDASTHVGPVQDQDYNDHSLNLRKDYRWQIREFGTDPLLIDLVYNQQLFGTAEQLLGADTLQPPTVGGTPMGSEGEAWPGGPVDPAIGDGIRGVYLTLPYGNKAREP